MIHNFKFHKSLIDGLQNKLKLDKRQIYISYNYWLEFLF